ncbi:MAG: sigma-54 dependent transcriptional regulator [Kofleriaceae bacterium]
MEQANEAAEEDSETTDALAETLRELGQLQREAIALRKQLRERVTPENMIGACPAMQRVFEIVEQVAASEATVMLIGEPGTGKELVACAIHERSPRARGPFIKLHCAGLSASLLERELLGSEHDGGEHPGALQLANGGTLFLDEVGEMSLEPQLALLHFLVLGTFERIGGDRAIEADVRVVASTSTELEPAVMRGRFREDLFAQLGEVSIVLPPLRERLTDLPALARLFCDRFAKQHDKAITGFSDDALALMASHDWPGNVRELERAVELAIILATTGELEPLHLPPSVRTANASGAPVVPGATMAELARYAILATLRATGSTTKAAEMLGISVRTIQYRLHEYNATGLIDRTSRHAAGSRVGR